MKRIPFVTREPIVRKPMTLSDLREPIFLDEPYKMYPVWGFEEVYEISVSGIIKKISTGDFIPLYECKTGKVVCLNHPTSMCGTLSANLVDVWSSTFLGDKALNFYSYMDSINKK